MPRRRPEAPAVAGLKQPSAGPESNGRQLEILETAAEIFNEKGYHNTSIQDIADAVGMLKGSLYYYISSKEDLLHQIFDQTHEGALDAVREFFESDAPADTRLHDLIVRQTVFHCRYRIWIGVFLHEYKAVSGPMRLRTMKLRQEYEANVRAIIVAGQKQGLFRKELDAAMATRALLGMTNWLYTWYSPRGKQKPEEIGEQFADLALRSLRA